MSNNDKRGGKSRFLVVSVALLAIGGLWLAALAPSALAKAGKAGGKKQAEFRMKIVKTEGNNGETKPIFMFPNGVVAFKLKITNVGEAAGKTTGDLSSFDTESGDPASYKAFEVPKLKPGKSHVLNVSISAYKDVFERQIGVFRSNACVKRNGKKGKDKCVSGPNFNIVPFAWAGTTTMTHFDSLTGATETAKATVAFKLERPFLAGSDFVWTAHGTVAYSISGGGGILGCSTYTGADAFGIGNPDPSFQLIIQPNLDSYYATGTTSRAYTIYAECPPFGSDTLTGPMSATWLDMGGQLMDSASTKRLTGSYGPDVIIPGITSTKYTWDLAAEVNKAG
jgi:hypothetical protein